MMLGVGGFQDVTVISYFRNPSELYLSSVQQTLKGSHSIPSPDDFPFRYTSLVRRWREHFHFIAKDFTRDKLISNDIVKDFVSTLADEFGIKGNEVNLSVMRDSENIENKTLSSPAMIALRDFRLKYYPDLNNFIDEKSKLFLRRLQHLDYSSKNYERQKLSNSIIEYIDQLNHDDLIKFRDLTGVDLLGKSIDLKFDSESALVRIKNIFPSKQLELTDILQLTEDDIERADGLLRDALNEAQFSVSPAVSK